MTNQEIIFREAINNKIYTEDECIEMLAKFGDIPLHTFSYWKSCGFQVKKGEHAMVTTQLWKLKKGTKKEEVEDVDPEDQPTKFYMCKSFLFHISQVEKMAV